MRVRENDFLTDQQIEELKRTLNDEQQKLTVKDLSKESFCLDKNELYDLLDEASENIEASKMLRFRNREVFYLKKIGQALQKIDQGVYGLCEECGAEISFERLVARPTAEMCIVCKEEAEVGEKSNFFLKKSKSLGQTLEEVVRIV